MSPDQGLREELIWATRGRSWGFRFLLSGGLPDPLREYERAFAQLGDEPMAWGRGEGRVAVRFPDPLRRKDAARRLIPHEFVVFGGLAEEIESVEDALQKVWPLVEGAYSELWDADVPPPDGVLGSHPRADSS